MSRKWTGGANIFIDIPANENHPERTVCVWVNFDLFTDYNYGCDADGNRGICRTDLDDFDYEIPNECEDGIPLTQGDKECVEKQLEERVDADWCEKQIIDDYESRNADQD